MVAVAAAKEVFIDAVSLPHCVAFFLSQHRNGTEQKRAAAAAAPFTALYERRAGGAAKSLISNKLLHT